MKKTAAVILSAVISLCSVNAYAAFDSILYTYNNKELPFDHTIIPDTCRIKAQSMKQYGEYRMMNGEYLFKSVKINSEHALFYADIINDIAAAVPDARVFNVLFTDSNEIYAPKEYTADQLGSIKKVYRHLNSDVTPVDAVASLVNHIGEKIYFSTDHHWTQRGAYYAYSAFAESAGFKTEPLSSFKDREYNLFYGSFAKKLLEKNASIQPEVLERIFPIRKCTLNVYNDQKMKQFKESPPLVDKNVLDYTTFIGGDNPLTVIHSSVKNGKKLCILKESFGNAFATWAVNDYEYVYVVDIRGFNNAGGSAEKFNIASFYNEVKFDDLVVISYPETIESDSLRQFMAGFADENNIPSRKSAPKS